jgi:hypothetical protein
MGAVVAQYLVGSGDVGNRACRQGHVSAFFARISSYRFAAYFLVYPLIRMRLKSLRALVVTSLAKRKCRR